MRFAVDERSIVSQRKMIQKVVPTFDETKDYCLWLVMDLFDRTLREEIIGTIVLLDKDGKELDLENYGLKKSKIIVRKPYPNKCINQIGVSKGRYKVFGVPLVCDDYEKLLQIKTVKVQWAFITPVYLSRNNGTHSFLDYEIVTLTTVHNISFDTEKVKENHWFTISIQDKLFMKEKMDSTRENYDYSFMVAKAEIDENEGCRGLDDAYGYFSAHLTEEDEIELSEKDKGLLDAHFIVDEQKLKDLVRTYTNKQKEEVGYAGFGMDWDCYYYERNITLEAEPCADILAGSDYGFED